MNASLTVPSVRSTGTAGAETHADGWRVTHALSDVTGEPYCTVTHAGSGLSEDVWRSTNPVLYRLLTALASGTARFDGADGCDSTEHAHPSAHAERPRRIAWKPSTGFLVTLLCMGTAAAIYLAASELSRRLVS